MSVKVSNKKKIGGPIKPANKKHALSVFNTVAGGKSKGFFIVGKAIKDKKNGSGLDVSIYINEVPAMSVLAACRVGLEQEAMKGFLPMMTDFIKKLAENNKK